MTNRTFIASEITRRLGYIQSDIDELRRLLKDETLSEGFHSDLNKAAADLAEIAKRARPRVPMAAE